MLATSTSNFIEFLQLTAPQDEDTVVNYVTKLNDFYTEMKIIQSVDNSQATVKLNSVWNLQPLDASTADSSGTDTASNESPEKQIFYPQFSDDEESPPQNSDDTEEDDTIPSSSPEHHIKCYKVQDRDSMSQTDGAGTAQDYTEDPEIAIEKFFRPYDPTKPTPDLRVTEKNKKSMATLCYKLVESLQSGTQTSDSQFFILNRYRT